MAGFGGKNRVNFGSRVWFLTDDGPDRSGSRRVTEPGTPLMVNVNRLDDVTCLVSQHTHMATRLVCIRPIATQHIAVQKPFILFVSLATFAGICECIVPH